MRFPWQRRKEKLDEADAALNHTEQQQARAEYDQAVVHDLSRWARERAAVRLDRLLQNSLRNQ